MKKDIFVCMVFSIALCTSLSAEAIGVIAHRGNWKVAGATQNTIKSLQAADSINCYASEFDVWLTRDKQMVVYHDENVYPTQCKVQYANYEKDIANIRLTNGDKIPFLSAYLDAATKLNTRLVFELKVHFNDVNEREAVRKGIEMLKEKGLYDKTDFITFSQNALKEFIRVTAGERPVYYLRGDLTPAQLKEMGAAGIDYNTKVLRKNPQWIEECHQLGMKVNIWTVDKPEDIQWSIDNNVDYITTNVPSLVKEMLKKNNIHED
ncbi:MAG: glycerophosphodiester phosphodiesterase family protein [Muribaculaceae bacterium]|nr:glycerophosphodiester phosphodiesterase family protein [Muribaculaceae bacterium]